MRAKFVAPFDDVRYDCSDKALAMLDVYFNFVRMDDSLDNNIDKETLVLILSSKLTKAGSICLAGQLIKSDVSLDVLHQTCYYSDSAVVCFRASWVLEYIALEWPMEFIAVFGDFFDRLAFQNNASCQRCFTKMIMFITRPNPSSPYRHAFKRIDKSSLVATIFEWLIDEQTPVATRVNCFDILFNLRHEFVWVADELKDQIEYFMPNGSVALQSRGRRILKLL